MSTNKQQPSSTLVTITDQLELKLIKIIADNCTTTTTTDNETKEEKKEISKSFLSKCETYIANADASNLIRSIIQESDAMESLLKLEPIEDCISAFSILGNLLLKVQDEDEEGTVLGTELADVILGDNDNEKKNSSVDVDIDISKRIMLIFTLYNLRQDGGEKCRLLARIVRLCASSPSTSSLLLRQTSTISNSDDLSASSSLLGDMIQVDRIVSVLQEWGVSVHHRRLLFRALVDAMKKITLMKTSVGAGDDESVVVLSPDDILEAELMRQRFLLLDIETYVDSSEVDAEALEAAEEASLGAIRDPITLFNEQRGMLDFAAVKALKKHNKVLYELLNIFQMGTLEDYQSFLKSHKDFTTTWSQANILIPEECLRHIRLLTFVSLASQGLKEIPYQTIVAKLQIPSSDVESWVISAVSHNLVTAKMDQLQQVVMVEKYLVRSFGFDKQEWKELETKLLEWKNHVKYVLDGLKECNVVKEELDGGELVAAPPVVMD